MSYIESKPNGDGTFDHSKVIEANKNGADVEFFDTTGQFWEPLAFPVLFKELKYRARLDIPDELTNRKRQSDKWDLEEGLAELLLAKFESGNEIPVERITITRAEIGAAFPGFFDEGDK